MRLIPRLLPLVFLVEAVGVCVTPALAATAAPGGSASVSFASASPSLQVTGQLPDRSSPLAQVADTSFRHDLHADFRCLDCHVMQAEHGGLLVNDVSDCRSCHHVRERSRGCAACHEAGELDDVVYPRDVGFDISVLDEPVVRGVDFSHEPHEERQCEECHIGDDPTLAPRDLDCGSCHEEHHVATSSGCMECHRDPGEDGHTLEVHETCSGSGCHANPPFPEPPPTRTGCLWCHEDMVDHEPDGQCVDCHFPVGGGDPAAAVPADPGRLPGIFGARYLHIPH